MSNLKHLDYDEKRDHQVHCSDHRIDRISCADGTGSHILHGLLVMTNAAYLIITKRIPWPGGQGFSSKTKIISLILVFSGIFVSLSSRSKILSLGNENKTSFTFAFHSFIRIFAIRIPKLQNMIDFLDLLAMEAIEDANKEREKEQWEDDNEDNDEEED